MSKRNQPQDAAPTKDQIEDAVRQDTSKIDAGVKSGELSAEDAANLKQLDRQMADQMEQGGQQNDDSDPFVGQ